MRDVLWRWCRLTGHGMPLKKFWWLWWRGDTAAAGPAAAGGAEPLTLRFFGVDVPEAPRSRVPGVACGPGRPAAPLLAVRPGARGHKRKWRFLWP